MRPTFVIVYVSIRYEYNYYEHEHEFSLISCISGAQENWYCRALLQKSNCGFQGNGSCAVISNRRGSVNSEMVVKLGFKVQC
jgi:hypothetical protein